MLYRFYPHLNCFIMFFMGHDISSFSITFHNSVLHNFPTNIILCQISPFLVINSHVSSRFRIVHHCTSFCHLPHLVQHFLDVSGPSIIPLYMICKGGGGCTASTSLPHPPPSPLCLFLTRQMPASTGIKSWNMRSSEPLIAFMVQNLCHCFSEVVSIIISISSLSMEYWWQSIRWTPVYILEQNQFKRWPHIVIFHDVWLFPSPCFITFTNCLSCSIIGRH